MWTVKRDYPENRQSLRLHFFREGELVSFKGFLQALASDPGCRSLLQEELRGAPFTAFRWETPPLTETSAGQAFSCRLHDSPDLDVPADPADFNTYFDNTSEAVVFKNLGGDALLVAPCPVSPATNYSHIAAFHRSAPQSQQDALWIEVAQVVTAQLGAQPLWLNTAGGGVDWLHVRVDQRPKYYRHQPWRCP